jgi:CTP synthase
MEHQDAYKSIFESLTHAGADADTEIDIVSLDAEDIEAEGADKFLAGVDGLLVPGGFGVRGIEGKIQAAGYARRHNIPYLGLCLGMQIAVVEFARNVLGLTKAHSTEFDPDTPDPVISLMDDQQHAVRLGGTMRLGAYDCVLLPGTHAHNAYGTDKIQERHRHRYEFNASYKQQMEEAGLIISGSSPATGLAEVVELRDHPWYAGCQYHPEFLSKPNKPHPLFKGFVNAALNYRGVRRTLPA